MGWVASGRVRKEGTAIVKFVYSAQIIVHKLEMITLF